MGTSKIGTKGNFNLSPLEHWGPVQQVGPCREDGTVAVNRIYECNRRSEIGRKILILCYSTRVGNFNSGNYLFTTDTK